MSIEKMERIWDPATAIEEIREGHGIVSFEKRAVITAASEGDEDEAPIIGAIAPDLLADFCIAPEPAYACAEWARGAVADGSARKAGWNEVFDEVFDEVTGFEGAWYREKPATSDDEERMLLSLEKIAYELEGIRQLGASSR